MTDLLPTSAPARRRTLPSLSAVRPSRTVAVCVGAVLVVVAAAGLLSRGGDPIVLPDTVAGMPTADPDFGSDGSWRPMMVPVYGDDDFAGRAYRSVGSAFQQLHVVVVAGDGAGKGDLESAGAARQQFGSVTCAPMVPGGLELSDTQDLSCAGAAPRT